MIPDERDTIVAIATARSGAARGVVRLSGPEAIAIVEALSGAGLTGSPSPTRRPGVSLSVELAGRAIRAPCDLYLWPGRQSYTRQPSAELHLLGSTPVVEAAVAAACRAGARLAQPGEFTLRAFLAGRIDLVQAEAVLGVIDAPNAGGLRAALGQLAGGLSQPLHAVREDVIQLLAEIEAGLDFVDEEDVRFIEPDELLRRVETALAAVESASSQASRRGQRGALPRVALVGPPNAGKSSLFNAILAGWPRGGDDDGHAAPAGAIVSPLAGTTRDSVAAEVHFRGTRFMLIDTAGRGVDALGIDALAARHANRDAGGADLRLVCEPVGSEASPAPVTSDGLRVVTQVDRLPAGSTLPPGVPTSSLTGEGIADLMAAVAARLGSADAAATGFVAATAERCRQSLTDAAARLAAAIAVARADQPELVAFELRSALDCLGEVTGAVVTDDLLDRVFSQFCIGK
ncbi:MAG: GTPase [Planctomycetota bacterium]